jgi:thymidine phosphorylase
LASGAAAERFGRMVAEMGGPSDIVENPDRHLARAPVVRPVTVPGEGYVVATNARAYGVTVMSLGGGRSRPEDAIDPAVGLTDIRGPGERVGPDMPLAVLHARSAADADRAATALLAATIIGDKPPLMRAVRDRIAA